MWRPRGMRETGSIRNWILTMAVAAAAVIGGQSALAETDEVLATLKELFRRPLSIPFPERAPYSPQMATLGKMLFFDPRLSDAQTVNCVSCHNPAFGYESRSNRQASFAHAIQKADHRPGGVGYSLLNPGKRQVWLKLLQLCHFRSCFLD